MQESKDLHVWTQNDLARSLGSWYSKPWWGAPSVGALLSNTPLQAENVSPQESVPEEVVHVPTDYAVSERTAQEPVERSVSKQPGAQNILEETVPEQTEQGLKDSSVCEKPAARSVPLVVAKANDAIAKNAHLKIAPRAGTHRGTLQGTLTPAKKVDDIRNGVSPSDKIRVNEAKTAAAQTASPARARGSAHVNLRTPVKTPTKRNSLSPRVEPATANVAGTIHEDAQFTEQVRQPAPVSVSPAAGSRPGITAKLAKELRAARAASASPAKPEDSRPEVNVLPDKAPAPGYGGKTGGVPDGCEVSTSAAVESVVKSPCKLKEDTVSDPPRGSGVIQIGSSSADTHAVEPEGSIAKSKARSPCKSKERTAPATPLKGRGQVYGTSPAAGSKVASPEVKSLNSTARSPAKPRVAAVSSMPSKGAPSGKGGSEMSKTVGSASSKTGVTRANNMPKAKASLSITRDVHGVSPAPKGADAKATAGTKAVLSRVEVARPKAASPPRKQDVSPPAKGSAVTKEAKQGPASPYYKVSAGKVSAARVAPAKAASPARPQGQGSGASKELTAAAKAGSPRMDGALANAKSPSKPVQPSGSSTPLKSSGSARSVKAAPVSRCVSASPAKSPTKAVETTKGSARTPVKTPTKAMSQSPRLETSAGKVTGTIYEDAEFAANAHEVMPEVVSAAVLRQLWDEIKSARCLYGQPCTDLRSFFQAIDTAQNGSISLSELTGAMERLDVGLSKVQFGRLFATIDTDQSGSVTFEALERFMLSDLAPASVADGEGVPIPKPAQEAAPAVPGVESADSQTPSVVSTSKVAEMSKPQKFEVDMKASPTPKQHQPKTSRPTQHVVAQRNTAKEQPHHVVEAKSKQVSKVSPRQADTSSTHPPSARRTVQSPSKQTTVDKTTKQVKLSSAQLEALEVEARKNELKSLREKNARRAQRMVTQRTTGKEQPTTGAESVKDPEQTASEIEKAVESLRAPLGEVPLSAVLGRENTPRNSLTGEKSSPRVSLTGEGRSPRVSLVE